MNPSIAQLQPYPFEKLKTLLKDVTLPDISEIAWGIGEPQHTPPPFLADLLTQHGQLYRHYPSTQGTLRLRQVIGDWCQRRFQLPPDSLSAEHHLLPVSGTREALFAAVQALFDRTSPKNEIWMPNPFYQIYEGAALLAGAEPRYLDCTAEQGYQPNYQSMSDADWDRCQLLFICTPGNPSGKTLSLEQLQYLVRKAQQHQVMLFSDECYSELYRDETQPPVGLLQAAASLGQHSFDNLLVFHSLSKRSNLPGLRSGFVAGCSHLISQFLRYRTYHGCAMPLPHQEISIACWQDEQHVRANRQQYNEKFQAVKHILGDKIPIEIPEGSFYLWPNLESDDTQVAKQWLSQAHIRVLPGQYLGRGEGKANPGYGHVRIALVNTLENCIEGAERLRKLL